MTKEFESEVPIRCTLLVDTSNSVRVGELLPLAYAFAEEVYPQLLSPDINQVPFRLRWFGTRPPWVLRHPVLADRLHSGLLRWGLACGLGSLLAGALAAALSVWWLMTSAPIQGDLLLWLLLGGAGSAVLAVALIITFLGWQVILPRRRRYEARRKKLVALLSVRHGLAPGGLEALLQDAEQMALHLQRFLAEHHVPFRLPFYDARGNYLFAAPEKVDVLARALLQAVGKGHDNELFVLLADLIELSDRLEPLLRAVRVALARHHQVMLVCPWPPGIPLVDGGRWTVDGEEDSPPSTEAALHRATTARFHRAFAGLRQMFARMGVPVICAADEESVALILDRMDRLRLVRRRR